MSIDEMSIKRANMGDKPPPFGGRHIHHQRSVCMSCGGVIFKRSTPDLADEWAHEEAFDDGDRRKCAVGYPMVLARPVETDDPIT